jgi:hypothetical protein
MNDNGNGIPNGNGQKMDWNMHRMKYGERLAWLDWIAAKGPGVIIPGGSVFLRGIGEQNNFCYEDGSRYEGGQFIDASDFTDNHALAKAQREYVRLRLDQEVHDYNEFRAWALNQAMMAKRYSNLPGIGQDSVDQLLAGQKRIEELRARLDLLDQVIGPEPVNHALDWQADYRRRCAREQDRVEADIRSMNI